MSSIISILLLTTLVTAQSPIVFKDIAAESGLDVPHVSSAENRYIIESMSGGVALLDCDSDGLLDAATVNGSTVENFRKGGDPFITLYRQAKTESLEKLRFENVTERAGLKRKGWGMGVTAVDFDNDGATDIFVTGFEGNAIYRGKGDCRFEDVTDATGLAGRGFMTGSAWADYDRDGDLDVFVAGYVSLDLDDLPVFGSSKTCSYKGIRVQCGPRGLPGERDFLYRNEGNGKFTEVAAKAGVEDKDEYFGLGVVWADYDNDGWPDLFVANDSSPNYLYRNNRDGTFTDVSFESGTSYSGEGDEQGSMGVTIEDFDWDGDLDIFVTNFESELNTLYMNLGEKGFLDHSAESRLGQPAKPFVGWGTAFVDLDNDTLLDVLVVNGHVYPQMELVKEKDEEGFRQRFILHRNLGNGKFEEITNGSGLEKVPVYSRRGAAFGDLNDDGLIDIIVTSLGEKPSLLLNRSVNKNKRLIVRLVREGSNREAIGSRLTVRTEKLSMMKEVQAGASYISQNDLRLHFGLGPDDKIVSAEVRWSDGKTEKIEGLVPNRAITVTQGKGVTSSSELKNMY